MSGSNSSARASAAAPEALGLAVHAVAGPDLADPAQAAQRRTVRGRFKMLAVLAVCAAPVVASYLAYFVVRPEARNNYGALIEPSRALPAALALRRLDGTAVDAHSLHGQWLLVAVGPSACDAGCERRLYMQRQLREMLGRERDRLDKVWLVTDAGAPAPTLLQALPATAVLRADRTALAAWLAPTAGQALEDHLYVVDPMGQWMLRFPADPDPARVKRDLERLLRAAAGWDKAGR